MESERGVWEALGAARIRSSKAVKLPSPLPDSYSHSLNGIFHSSGHMVGQTASSSCISLSSSSDKADVSCQLQLPNPAGEFWLGRLDRAPTSQGQDPLYQPEVSDLGPAPPPRPATALQWEGQGRGPQGAGRHFLATSQVLS